MNNYLHWLNEQGLTASTIRNYAWTIRLYGSQPLTTEQISQFLKANLTKYEASTVRNQINALKTYATFKNQPIEWKKVVKIIPRIQPKFYTTINPTELSQLKQITWRANGSIKETHRINQRNNLILDFLFYSGLRINELVNIRHRDWQGNQLKVLGKGNKVRYVFLPEFLIKHFQPYTNDYLFLTRNGTKLKDVQVRTIIKRKTERAGIIKRITPHTFRRSLATNLYNQGGRLETIQKQLGHASLDTTMGYIHNSWEELYRDYSKLWLGGIHV